MLYMIAGTWGNHEGSMLLLVTIMGLAGVAVALFERSLRRDTHMATLGAQAVISLGFYAFLLFPSNPFERLKPPAPDGQGLNPLLQDPGLAFHPPTLYFGYVGLSVAFSFAVGALMTRNVDAAFARAMRPRSEEHTSELQSLMRISYAVFCLKKKRTTQKIQNT